MYNESLHRVKDTQARFELEAASYRLADEVTNNSNEKSNKAKGKRAWIVSLSIAVGLVVVIFSA